MHPIFIGLKKCSLYRTIQRRIKIRVVQVIRDSYSRDRIKSVTADLVIEINAVTTTWFPLHMLLLLSLLLFTFHRSSMLSLILQLLYRDHESLSMYAMQTMQEKLWGLSLRNLLKQIPFSVTNWNFRMLQVIGYDAS